jgi:hypothetical protein
MAVADIDCFSLKATDPYFNGFAIAASIAVRRLGALNGY